MRGKLGTLAAVALAGAALAVPLSNAEEPLTKEEYKAAVEPICKRDREAGEKILRGAQDNIREGRLAVAGRQLIRASGRFGETIGQLVAVPRPPADEERLQKWLGFLRIVKDRLRQTGVYYREGERLKATHESIRTERSGNAANNVSFPFGFRYCRLGRSRFS
jgi:hypothetical protein